MGKKNKVGKSRKDKFYHLAKETGFRARSAFKLLQLNRKYEFLPKSRVCIDLCAAPGGWLQVAAQQMPVSSLIIGVDLVPIKPIPHTTTFQADITTEKCRQQLRKEMQTWKADVVLHDGAPNVGKNWVHDAFAQAELTLQALKLATEFLRKGGCFVTKVFRSKDYHALLWVFGQLFKKVHATKPQASRNESAEIFVVCQFYREPDKIDPKFLDPKYVFKEVNDDGKMPLNLIHPEKVKKRTEGYADGDYTCHQKVNVSDFIAADNHTEILAECSEIVIDVDEIANHSLTTTEIKECCKDIKVLGKKELRNILNWRKKMKAHMDSLKQESEGEMESDTEKMEVENGKVSESESEKDEEGNLDKQISDIYDEERREAKRQRKKVMKEKRKLRDKMSLNMIIPGDQQDITDDVNLFDLKRIKSKQSLKAASRDDMEEGRSESESEDEDVDPKRKKQMMKYDRYATELNEEDDVMPSSDDDDELEMESDDDDGDDDLDDEEEEEESEKNPLVLDLEAKDAKTKRKTEMWFNKDVFNDLEDEADEDLEIEKMTEEYKKKGGTIIEKKSANKKKKKQQTETSSEEDSDSGHASDASSDDENNFNSNGFADSDSDSDSDSDDSDYDADKVMQKSLNAAKGQKRNRDKEGFEIVPAGQTAKKIRKLDPVGLAIGEELVKSSKRRREIIENSYNRYTFNDDNLPDWFVKEEKKHNKPQLPVSKEKIQEYKEKQKAIDARPIKKIAEAKGRKKRKMSRKLEKARKKAEVVSETVDVTDKEKMSQIKQIYKKAGLLKKKKEDITYVVAKKGTGKRVRRPAGVKGQFKVVDPRMKKDEMKRKKILKATKGGRKKAKGNTRK